MRTSAFSLTDVWQLATSHSLPATSSLSSHDLDDHPLVALAVEFRIEDSLPRAEIELADGNRHNHFMMNQQRLQVRVSVILARLMMLVLLAKGRQTFQPVIDVF